MFFRRSTSETLIYIFESEILAIVGEAQRFPSSETGGDLFGTFTHGNMPVIWLASGPGPNAKHFSTHFEQDVSFTSEWQRRFMNEFGIQYVGSWHSHHTLSLNFPSGGDAESARNYAAHHHRQRTLEIIVNHEGRKPKTVLRPYFYPNAQEGGWIAATFTALPGESPLRCRLGRDEVTFSCDVDWKKIASHTFALDSHKASTDAVDIPYSDADSLIPDQLQKALQGLHREGIEVEQRGEIFMVIIPLTTTQVLAVAVQNGDEVTVLQANFIDYAFNTNTNISERLTKDGHPLTLNAETVRRMERNLPLTGSSTTGWTP